jgi:hypothetical protein
MRWLLGKRRSAASPSLCVSTEIASSAEIKNGVATSQRGAAAASASARPSIVHLVQVRQVDVPARGALKVERLHLIERTSASKVAAPAAATTPRYTDGRQQVSALLSKHAAAVDAVRAAVSTDRLYDERRHDTLWLLRFVLSHKGNIAAAVAAARGTMAYRHEHRLDDPEYDRTHMSRTALEGFHSSIGAGAVTYYTPDTDRQLLLIGRVRDLDFHRIVATMSPEETAHAGRLSSEFIFRYCDEVTRRTGLLTKYVRFIDLSGIRLGGMNREFQRRDRELSRQLEDFYPQLLEAVYLCHAPFFLQSIWRAMRPLLPERFVDKVPHCCHATPQQTPATPWTRFARFLHCPHRRTILTHVCRTAIPAAPTAIGRLCLSCHKSGRAAPAVALH